MYTEVVKYTDVALETHTKVLVEVSLIQERGSVYMCFTGTIHVYMCVLIIVLVPYMCVFMF